MNEPVEDIIPSCTPRSLHSLVVSRLAKMVIDSAIPSRRMHAIPRSEDLYGSCPHRHNSPQDMDFGSPALYHYDDSTDAAILAEAGSPGEDLLATREELLAQWKGVVDWLREEVWLGVAASRVRSRCGELIERLGITMHSNRLFLLTLELLFSHEAGRLPTMENCMTVELCRTYGNFLSSFKPFSISRLYTTSLEFNSPLIITTICRLSPLLRFVHLRIDYVDGEMLREIGKTLPNLETLIIVVEEYEIYDDISSTVNIVIDGGENFENDLFCGFFDGLSKEDIKLKIKNDQVKDIRLSFPRLKFVDVGSHRDVREFLHYLLHLYTDLYNISCNGEGWQLSKYSLAFPSITPSTLGCGPDCLQDFKTPYNLQHMSFSSFCLVSRLPDMMERYRSLQHVTLHLLKGPWKINITCRMARALLSASSSTCRGLTLCVDVYMSKEDLVSLYCPTLQAFSSSLTVLQFHLTNEVSPESLRQLINLCHTLEELAIVSSCERCEVAEYDEGEQVTPLNKLPTLRCLGISSKYNMTTSLFNLTAELLVAAPNLTTLDLESGDQKLEKWLVEAATEKLFSRLQRLRLSLFHRQGVIPRDKFHEKPLYKLDVKKIYEPIIASAPRLTELMVGYMNNCILPALRAKYEQSQLHITTRVKPCVAFRTLASHHY